jgi:hypothetical protein
MHMSSSLPHASWQSFFNQDDESAVDMNDREARAQARGN